MKGMIVALLVAAALGWLVAEVRADEQPTVCVSAVGPVDQNGRGQSVAVTEGDCP